MDILSLMMDLGFLLSAFLVAIIVIVTVHELGHYLVGRWLGIHAEVFSVGFGRPLLRRRDRHGTLWQLALLPIGGYVKFKGDGSPSSGSAEPVSGSYAGAPLHARALTVAAGPAVNFLFAIVIFAAMAVISGLPEHEPRIGALRSLPVDVGFQPGDLVLEVGGLPVESLEDIRGAAGAIEASPSIDWTILRGESRLEVPGPFPNMPVIDSIRTMSAAQDAGLRVGDVILAVDGGAVHGFGTLRERIFGSDGATLDLRVWRDGSVFTVPLTPTRVDMPDGSGAFVTRWMAGFSVDLPFRQAARTPGPLEALAIGGQRSLEIVSVSVSAVDNIVRGAISHCNIRGVVTMAEASGSAASLGAASFIAFIAVLSVIIGFMNLMPIPTLDGGHLVFHAWEAVTGRAPGHRVASAMMTMGMLALIALMTFGLVNDLMC